MNTKITVACVVAFLATQLLAQVETRRTTSPSPAGPAPAVIPSAVRTVEWLMRNGEGLRDKITVEGVVRQVSAKARALALIDVQEFRECGLKACAEYELPVRWQGAMPAVGRGVRASGFVEKARGKLVFVARSIEAFDVPATEAK